MFEMLNEFLQKQTLIKISSYDIQIIVHLKRVLKSIKILRNNKSLNSAEDEARNYKDR